MALTSCSTREFRRAECSWPLCVYTGRSFLERWVRLCTGFLHGILHGIMHGILGALSGRSNKRMPAEAILSQTCVHASLHFVVQGLVFSTPVNFEVVCATNAFPAPGVCGRGGLNRSRCHPIQWHWRRVPKCLLLSNAPTFSLFSGK